MAVPRNGHNRSLHCVYQILDVTRYDRGNFVYFILTERKGFGGLSQFESFESHAQSKKKNHTKRCGFFFLAEDEGFEPPRTESESGVLPLH